MKPAHCRMARAGLGWTTRELARRAGVGVNTVSRFERGADVRLSSVSSIQAALEAAGAVFVEDERLGVFLSDGKTTGNAN